MLRGASTGRGELVPPAQRPDRRSTRILLGGPAGVRPTGVFLVAAAADLPGPAVCARSDPCSGGLRRSRRDGGTAFGEAQPQGGDPHTAARAEEGPDRKSTR